MNLQDAFNVDSEDLTDEQLMELERQDMIKEQERILAEKKQRAFERKRKRIVCCQKLCCFKDEQ